MEQGMLLRGLVLGDDPAEAGAECGTAHPAPGHGIIAAQKADVAQRRDRRLGFGQPGVMAA